MREKEETDLDGALDLCGQRLGRVVRMMIPCGVKGERERQDEASEVKVMKTKCGWHLGAEVWGR